MRVTKRIVNAIACEVNLYSHSQAERFEYRVRSLSSVCSIVRNGCIVSFICSNGKDLDGLIQAFSAGDEAQKPTVTTAPKGDPIVPKSVQELIAQLTSVEDHPQGSSDPSDS